MIFNPRGMHASEGAATFANTLSDIGAALRWLERPDVQQRFKVDSARLALGGHSFGGGMAMAYAARDRRVGRVISIAGNDHGEFAREFQRNAAFAEIIGGWEDVRVTVDQILLPLYRSLKRAGASDVTFVVYHDDHNFDAVREQLASDIRGWLLAGQASLSGETTKSAPMPPAGSANLLSIGTEGAQITQRGQSLA